MNFELSNAFFGDFDGDGVPDLSFGQDGSTGIDYGYDADVVYHEFGHSAVSELAPSLAFIQADGWGMEWVSGAVREGAADGWAMLLTHDPVVGEYAGGIGDRPAVRDLQTLRRCPDDLQGEVHADGELLGSLVWAFMDHPDIVADVAAELLFGATALWGSQLDWPRVGTAFVDTAADVLASAAVDATTTHAATLEVLERSGIPSCGRSIPLQNGQQVELFVPTLGLQGDLSELPGCVQLTVDVPADAISATLDVSRFDGPEGMGWVVHGRVGDRIRHRFTEVDALGLGFATAAEYDWRVEGDGPRVMAFDLDSEPPVVPGETLFLSVASRNAGTLTPLDFTFGRLALATEVGRVAQLVLDHGQPGWGCGLDTGATPGWGWPVLGIVACRRRRRDIARRDIACENAR